LNGLLLVYGADLKPQLPTTHKAVSSYIKHVWTVHTGLPLKVCVEEHKYIHGTKCVGACELVSTVPGVSNLLAVVCLLHCHDIIPAPLICLSSIAPRLAYHVRNDTHAA
jgi:hypothetical protein